MKATSRVTSDRLADMKVGQLYRLERITSIVTDKPGLWDVELVLRPATISTSYSYTVNGRRVLPPEGDPE